MVEETRIQPTMLNQESSQGLDAAPPNCWQAWPVAAPGPITMAPARHP